MGCGLVVQCGGAGAVDSLVPNRIVEVQDQMGAALCGLLIRVLSSVWNVIRGDKRNIEDYLPYPEPVHLPLVSLSRLSIYPTL